MKRFYKITGIFFLMSCFPFGGLATTFSHEKSVKKSQVFPANSSTYVEIENKYGDVEVDVWDKDSVKIDVEIKVYSDDMMDLQELLGMIDVNFKGTSSFVLAETQWQEDVGLLQKGIYKFNKEFGNNVKIEVHYWVSVPENLSLSITNKFGNIFLGNYQGDLEVDLSYGDLRAHQITNAKKIRIKSGKLKVKSIDKGHLNLSFAKSVHIDEAVNLTIESTSSEITLDQIKELNMTSRHDEVNIEKVEKLIGKFTLSDIYIDRAKFNINAITKYGTFVIKEVGDEAEIIHLEGNRTDFRLGYSSVFFGSIEVDVTNESQLSYGKDVTIESSLSPEKDHFLVKGYINDTGSAKLIIKNKNGYVQLKGL